MERQAIIETLRENEAALKGRGVAHAALFGSRARGDHGADSDIDVVIDIDPNRRIGVFGLAGIMGAITDLFSVPVDVVERNSLRQPMRDRVERDAVHVF